MKIQFTKFAALVLLLSSICSFHLSAQTKVVTLLQGTITDEATGKPVGCDFEITDAAGAKTRGKSATNNGSYQAVLEPGGTYSIMLYSYDILRKTETVTLPLSKAYSVAVRDFKVQKLRSGMELHALHAFSTGQSTLSADATTALTELKEMMRRNRTLTIIATVYGDAELKPPPPPAPIEPIPVVKPKKGKTPKGKKVVEPPPPPPPAPIDTVPPKPLIDELAVARGVALKAFLQDVKNADIRIKVITDAPFPQGANGASPTFKNAIINVGEVKSLFD
ncbi:MAG: hypothetical protein IPM69_07440 [Ignavibacteria bacterium]|nr:hypothetical protein [Ignavibacteria bacterium]